MGEDIDRHAIASGIFIFGVIMLIASIVATVISACLVHGARTANVCLMKPWIVLTGISLILDIFNILKAVISLAFTYALSSIFGWVLRVPLPGGLVLQEGGGGGRGRGRLSGGGALQEGGARDAKSLSISLEV